MSVMSNRKPIPAKLRHEVFKRDNYRCRECGATNKETTLEIDHIVPVSKGGTNDLTNLQTLCKKCNRAKHTRTWVGGVSSNKNSNYYISSNCGLGAGGGVSNYPTSKIEKKENASTKTKSTKKLDKKEMKPIYSDIIKYMIVTGVLIIFIYSIFPTLGLLTFFLILICYLVGMREPIKKFINSKLLQKK